MIEASIIQAITNAVTLPELTADNTKPYVNQGTALPWCYVMKYSSRHDISHQGEMSSTYSGIQVAVTAATSLKASQLARAIQKLFNAYQGTLEGSTVFFIEAVQLQAPEMTIESDAGKPSKFTNYIDLQIVHLEA